MVKCAWVNPEDYDLILDYLENKSCHRKSGGFTYRIAPPFIVGNGNTVQVIGISGPYLDYSSDPEQPEELPVYKLLVYQLNPKKGPGRSRAKKLRFIIYPTSETEKLTGQDLPDQGIIPRDVLTQIVSLATNPYLETLLLPLGRIGSFNGRPPGSPPYTISEDGYVIQEPISYGHWEDYALRGLIYCSIAVAALYPIWRLTNWINEITSSSEPTCSGQMYSSTPNPPDEAAQVRVACNNIPDRKSVV